MTRRHAIAMFTAIPVVPIEATAKSMSYLEVSNDFVTKYNNWLEFVKVSQPGIINVKEVSAWKDTERALKTLKRVTQY